jgi:peptide/nickel transport system substrate-binding protein
MDLGVVRERMKIGDFDLVTLTLPELTEPHIFRQMLHSAFVPPQGTNRGRVSDPVLDALLERGGSENDRTVRREIYAKVAERVVAEMHIVPLWHEDQVAVVSDRAREFMPSAEGRWLSLARLP